MDVALFFACTKEIKETKEKSLHSPSSCQHWGSAKPLLQLPECWSSGFRWGWRGTGGPRLAGTVIQSLQVGKRRMEAREAEKTRMNEHVIYLFNHRREQPWERYATKRRASTMSMMFYPRLLKAAHVGTHLQDIQLGWRSLCSSSGGQLFLKAVLCYVPV